MFRCDNCGYEAETYDEIFPVCDSCGYCENCGCDGFDHYDECEG